MDIRVGTGDVGGCAGGFDRFSDALVVVLTVVVADRAVFVLVAQGSCWRYTGIIVLMLVGVVLMVLVCWGGDLLGVCRCYRLCWCWSG